MPASARWTGYLRAAESGPHHLRLKGGPGYRIRIDGKLVTDLWDIAWPTSNAPIELAAGKVYKIEIEARQTGWDGEQPGQNTMGIESKDAETSPSPPLYRCYESEIGAQDEDPERAPTKVSCKKHRQRNCQT